jgi:hypothetical protein
MQKGDADDAHSIDVAPRALAGQHAGSDEHAEAIRPLIIPPVFDADASLDRAWGRRPR